MVLIASVELGKSEQGGMGDDEGMVTGAEGGGELVKSSPAATEQQSPGCAADGGISRMSPSHIFRVVQNLSEYKKDLIRVIGFGGILEMPNLPKLNLRFSKWLLGRLDYEKQAILVDAGRYIRFHDADVEKVFGIPCGSRSIDGQEKEVNPVVVGFMRSALGLVGKDAHSLKKVEEFLSRDISQESSSLEKDCFQVAFVIFVMGLLLAPTTKHDCVAIDYWGALKCASDIPNYNWCSYVVRSILEAAQKFQAECAIKTCSNVPGCHLFLQVFFLDNMDLRRYSLRHSVFPRIKEFTAERLKAMISECVAGSSSEDMRLLVMARTAENVCYVRSSKENAWGRGVKYEKPYHGGPFSPASTKKPTISAPANISSTPAPRRVQLDTPQTQKAVPSFAKPIDQYVGANGLHEFLRDKYPVLNTASVMNVLKRHNAMCIKHVVDSQRALQQLLVKENIMLADKIVSLVGVEAIVAMGTMQGSSDFKAAGGTPSGSQGSCLRDEGEGQSFAEHTIRFRCMLEKTTLLQQRPQY